MKLICSRCKRPYVDRVTPGEIADMKPDERYQFVNHGLCYTCAHHVKVTVTALGALACHVVHISGQLSKNVSRETS